MRIHQSVRSAVAVNALSLLIVFGILFGFFDIRPKERFDRNLDQGHMALSVENTFRRGDAISIPDVVAMVDPAVVSVVVTKDVPVIERYFEDYSPFGGFFGFPSPFGSFQVPRERQNGTEEQEVGGGSGFIVSADGLIVTNRHVVSDDQARYSVLLNTGEDFEVEVIARDTVLDIAVLSIIDAGAREFPHLVFGNSDELRTGQSVIAIGNALGEFRNSVSVGVVSGLARSIVAGDGRGNTELLDGVIQTDAAINPGNSGGPLLDELGQVIGVNVAVAGGSENIGFALPGNVVATVVQSIQEHGRIVRPFLGVRYITVNDALIEANDLAVEYGALVQRGVAAEDLAVMPGSPADKAGLVENDIILSVDGVALTEGRTLAGELRSKEVGQTIILEVWSKGIMREVSVVLEEAKSL